MPQTLLRQHRLKATAPRVALLTALRQTRRPVTVETLYRQVNKRDVSLATTYRTVEEFARVGLASKVDLDHGHAHYEYADPRRHHHHVVCTDCGRVEDVAVPHDHHIVTKISKKTHFTIQRHAMEFFGLCQACQ